MAAISINEGNKKNFDPTSATMNLNVNKCRLCVLVCMFICIYAYLYVPLKHSENDFDGNMLVINIYRFGDDDGGDGDNYKPHMIPNT